MITQVRIYTTRYCSFCFRAKSFFEEKGVEFEDVDVTGDYEERKRLVEVTGRTTVPQIFIGEQPVGGFTDLVALERAGELDSLLGLS